MNLGTYKQKTTVTKKIVTNKYIRAATGSCGCTSLEFDDKEFEFNWKLPEIPFQIEGDMQVSMSVDVWYTDDSKEIFVYSAKITK